MNNKKRQREGLPVFPDDDNLVKTRKTESGEVPAEKPKPVSVGPHPVSERKARHRPKVYYEKNDVNVGDEPEVVPKTPSNRKSRNKQR